jgi:two-component system, OmpR family, alkaline phosphatase synthesis response regulator PhoP
VSSNILVIDDEPDILEVVAYNLKREGYQVRCVGSGGEGLKAARDEKPHLLILDLMLPGVEGLDICRLLKTDEKTKDILILILSAKGEEGDIVSGLELGADDYLVKPFSPKILLARVKSLLRRQAFPKDQPKDVVVWRDLSIDRKRHEVRILDQPIDLTSTEFKILDLLVTKAGWVFTRNKIVDEVHGEDYPVTDRSVDVQIVGLRKKLSEYGKYIETVRGVGYRFREIDEKA